MIIDTFLFFNELDLLEVRLNELRDVVDWFVLVEAGETRELREATAAERHAGRQERSVPILDELRAWLDQQAPQALPKSALGQAIAYGRNQWPKLTAFLQDGRLELDNNRCERAVKPFVIGRKNWLFSNTPRGARASAVIYSVVETARENNLRPLDYLTHILEQLPRIDTTDNATIDKLMPWTEHVQTLCGSPTKTI